MDKTRELKALQTRLKKSNDELTILKKQQSELSHKISFVTSNINDIKDEIRSIQARPNKVIISEHALLRYLERVKNIDTEGAKEEILAGGIEEQIKTLGDGVFPKENFKLKVKNNTIITVI